MAEQIVSRHEEAIRRFQIIAPLLDRSPDRMAERVWRDQICDRAGISKRTLRRWLQQYRQHGLDGLYPKERKDKGRRKALSDKALDHAKQLRVELPERSAERICEVLHANGHQAARSKPERHLRLSGYSGRMLKREGNTNNTGPEFDR